MEKNPEFNPEKFIEEAGNEESRRLWKQLDGIREKLATTKKRIEENFVEVKKINKEVLVLGIKKREFWEKHSKDSDSEKTLHGIVDQIVALNKKANDLRYRTQQEEKLYEGENNLLSECLAKLQEIEQQSKN